MTCLPRVDRPPFGRASRRVSSLDASACLRPLQRRILDLPLRFLDARVLRRRCPQRLRRRRADASSNISPTAGPNLLASDERRGLGTPICGRISVLVDCFSPA